MPRWLQMMAAAWVTVSEVTRSRSPVTFSLSLLRRVIWMAWAAWGKASPSATRVTFTCAVRCGRGRARVPILPIVPRQRPVRRPRSEERAWVLPSLKRCTACPF